MAATAAGAQLTERHRFAQLAIRSRAVGEMLRVWPALDPEHPLEHWVAVERAALAIVRDARGDSARTSAQYVRDFRAAEIGVSRTITPAAFDEEAIRAATASLRVTGALTARRLVEIQAPDPLATTFVRMTGAVARIALNGGRETVERAVQSDDRSLGWSRTVSGRACYFCAMLASRGPVYKRETVSFRAHDHCACGMEPVYRAGAAWPPQTREFQRLWRETTASTSGQDSVRAFRRAYDAAA